MFGLEIFGPEFKNNVVILEFSALELAYLQNLAEELNVYTRDQKCFIWVFSDWNFKKLLSYLKSVPLILPKGLSRF